MAQISPNAAGGSHVVAFLDMLAHSEGTSTDPKTQNDGYDVIVGGEIFTDYTDHPRVLVDLPRLGIKSTAAGRYQILARYYDVYKEQLVLPDFGPVSQDRIAIQMIHECHAVDAIVNGDIETAIGLCASRWASLPGNSYGQHAHTVQLLLQWYQDALG